MSHDHRCTAVHFNPDATSMCDCGEDAPRNPLTCPAVGDWLTNGYKVLHVDDVSREWVYFARMLPTEPYCDLVRVRLEEWRMLTKMENVRVMSEDDVKVAREIGLEARRQYMGKGPRIVKPVAPCANCGHEARDHMVDDEERRECAACMCKQYEAKK